MSGRENYEKDLLEWKERQFELRARYRDTPAGFQSEEQEAGERIHLEEARGRYRESCVMRLLTQNNRMPEEIFVGREAILSRIEKELMDRQAPVILYGMGGMGKSSIAREYVRRKGKDYDHVLFIYGDAGIRSAICDDVQVSISNLQYSRDEYGSRINYFREKIRVLTGIAGEEKLLLVIDDWNREKDAGRDEVFAIPCDIIVTTRMHPSVWGFEGGIPISGFETRQEWDQFLSAYAKGSVSEEERECLDQYCRQVGGQVLLMKIRIADNEWREGKTEDMTEAIFSEGKPSLENLMDLFSRFSLRQEEKQALRELSVMPVKGIPQSLYLKISKVSAKTLDRLESCLLLNRQKQDEECVLSLHPLVAEAVRQLFTPTLTNCRGMVAAFCNAQWNMWEDTYAENQKMEPYVFAIMKAFPRPLSWFAIELERLSTWLWIQEYYEEAEEWQKKIVECVERDFGEYHQLTGEMYLRMAAVYYNWMDIRQANIWYEKAFRSLSQCEPLDTRYKRLMSEVNMKLARRYQSEGLLEKAAFYNEKGTAYFDEYRKFCREKGILHSHDTDIETVWQSHRLRKAELLFLQGITDEALALCTDAKAAMRKIEGAEYRLNEYDQVLIMIYQAKGDFTQAEQLAIESLERALHYRGRYFKDTLMCREQMGDLYMAAGRTQEAAQEYRIVFEDLNRHFQARRDWIERVGAKLAEAGDRLE
ncbi:MAG: hypothetical protein LIO92_08935 [Clostridiales bacterium]|nr:hypothetical protein [Clostridiales bacterium]